jgi:hypothetical protein
MTAANGRSIASDPNRDPGHGWLPGSVIDPKGGGTGRNVLVVSTVAEPAAALGAELRQDDIVKVVVPVVGQGLLDWLANDERAFARASEAAETTAQELPGTTVGAAAGEADVALAIRDALATFPADEIVVAVAPDTYDVVDEALTTDRSAAGVRMIEGVPVRVVTLAGPTGR